MEQINEHINLNMVKRSCLYFFMEEFKISGCFSKAYAWFSEAHELTSKKSPTLRKHEHFLIMSTHFSGSYICS